MVLWPHPFIPKASSKLKQQRETFYRCPMFLVKAAARYWLFLRVSSCFCRLQQISPVVTCLILSPVKQQRGISYCCSMFLEKNCRLLRNASSSFLTTLVLPFDLATLDTLPLMDTTCYEDEGLYRRVKYTGQWSTLIAALDTRATICQSSIK